MTQRSASEPVAIVGMACRFAGAPDVQTFWNLLVSAQEGVADYPVGRTTELDNFYGAAGSDLGAPSRRGGFVANIDTFDADFFQISPREAELMDPQQRLLLELTWEALEDAGQAVERITGPRTGVFVGAWASDYERHLEVMQTGADVQSTIFNGLFATSSRVAFAFDFRGPELSINAGCASSLTAIHEGIAALRGGRCDVAIVGGVNAIIRPEITQALGKASVLSTDGRCKFGDVSADGYVRGEGGGLLVLKRLDQAIADGDRARAVIRGSAINNSGSSSGFIKRPSEVAQAEVILAALSDAGLSAADVSYVEAHGTGTTAGDPIELAALSASIGRDANRTEPCLVGSVKANIGHAEAAAGMAGVIKTVLALEHRYLPPTLNVITPNPAIDWENAGIALNTKGRSWPEGTGRLAGVSSFAMGGTNAHVILEEAPAFAPASHLHRGGTWLLPLSANSLEALRTLASEYADILERRSDLGDIIFTAANRRSMLPHRLAVVGRDSAELASRLRSWAAEMAPPFVSYGSVAAEPNFGVVLVFSGQGSQWFGMARELITCEPAFDAAITRCDEEIQAETGWSVRQLLTAPDTDWADVGIDKVQPALFSVQVALAALWASWGVEPSAVVGHSMGEIAAAHVAGVLSLRDAARIICRRCALMTRFTGQGGMALIELSLDEAESVLRGVEDRLSVAVSNGPRTTIISGEPQALQSVVDRLQESGVFCRSVAVQVAAHSPQMGLIREELLRALQGLQTHTGHTPIYSTTLGRFADGAEFGAHYWADNLRQPVLFHAALKALMVKGWRIFIEASPNPVLLPAIDETGRDSRIDVLTVPSMRRDEPERATMLAALGRLFVRGMALDFSRLYPSGNVVDVPSHPWRRRRFWPVNPTAALLPIAPGGHALLPTRFRTAEGSWIWNARLDPENLPWLQDHSVRGMRLLPASAYVEMAIMAARQIFGHERVLVEALELKEAIALSPPHQLVQLIATMQQYEQWFLKFHAHDASSGIWTLAATVRLKAEADDSNYVPASLEPAELERFKSHQTEGVSGLTHATCLKRLGYEFGPDFLNLVWLDIDAEQVHAFAQLDDRLRAVGYAMHPALLDAGFQALLAGINHHLYDQKLLIPRRIGRARILPTAGSGRAAYIDVALSDHGKSMLGDVRLYGKDGALLAEACGLEFQALTSIVDKVEVPLVYSNQWLVAERGFSATNAPSNWLILADEQGIAKAFASEMRARGHSADIIDPQLLGTSPLAAGGGIVDFGGLNLPNDASIDQVAEHSAKIAAQATLLSETAGATLWLVTRGACAVRSNERVSVPQASVWGLGATIANECQELNCRLLDLTPGGGENECRQLATEVLSRDPEPHVAFRDGQRYVARLRAPTNCTPPTARPLGPSERAELAIGSPGVLDSLSTSRTSRRSPSPGEIEIEVQAAGVNFLDIMRALGLFDPIVGREVKLGVECAGCVAAVGDGVTEFKPGDRVVALSPAFQEVGTFASHLVTRASLASKIPDHLSISEAAALPCAYLTAYFALVEAARTRPGETVLIHSATGGVGRAAIEVARWLGAKIIASAGTEVKRLMLREMGIDCVLDSRSGQFARIVAEATGGRGADVILNSLSGAAIPEGLAALAPYGRFLEIGKRDMWENSPIGFGALLQNRSVFGIDLATMIEDQPEFIGHILRRILALVEEGTFSSLPITVFPAARASEALHEMAAARHIGKIVIDTRAMEVSSEPTAVSVRPDSSYLITGGLGALGLVAAEELVEAGARDLVLCGRNPPSEEALTAIDKLRARGANVISRSVDIGNEGQLRDLLNEISATLPPLKGVVHAAGVLDDALVGRLSPERFRTVMCGKVEGARLLDRLTVNQHLDFFILFSSVAALLGSPGQGNYAAANAMLDALAADRSARGQPGLSIGWGPWAEIGLAAAESNRGVRIAARGLPSLVPDEGRLLFRSFLAGGVHYVAAMRFDPVSWLDVAAPSAKLFLGELIVGASESITSSPAQLRGGTGDLRESVVEQLSAVLRTPVDSVVGDRPFRSLGMDSLMGLELRNRLERVLGLKLSASVVWNFPTVNQLSAHLTSRLEPLETSSELDSQLAAARALDDEILQADALLTDR